MQNSDNNYYDDKWNLFMEKIFGREWRKDSNIWSMKINDKYYVKWREIKVGNLEKILSKI